MPELPDFEASMASQVIFELGLKSGVWGAMLFALVEEAPDMRGRRHEPQQLVLDHGCGPCGAVWLEGPSRETEFVRPDRQAAAGSHFGTLRARDRRMDHVTDLECK